MKLFKVIFPSGYHVVDEYSDNIDLNIVLENEEVFFALKKLRKSTVRICHSLGIGELQLTGKMLWTNISKGLEMQIIGL